MELFQASQQWATRPADERFGSLVDMHDQCKEYADSAATSVVKWDSLRVEATDDKNLRLVGRAGVPALLTHYAFGQVCNRIGAPASYMRDIPATLSAQNLNYGLARRDGDAALLFHRNGDLILRAATSEQYTRIWNHEVVERLIVMSQQHNLIPGMQTFAWPGMTLPPVSERAKSLYASDHDMFAFLMSEDKNIVDPRGNNMRRGVIVTNSEVGASALKFMGFYFVDVCANHIIWGAQDLAEVSLRHVGNMHLKMGHAIATAKKYLNGAASIDEAKILQARVQIAGTKEQVLDKLFGIRTLALPRKTLEAGYDAAKPETDGPPNTVWGMVQGLTRHSQTTPYTDERTTIDRAAGKLLSMTF